MYYLIMTMKKIYTYDLAYYPKRPSSTKIAPNIQQKLKCPLSPLGINLRNSSIFEHDSHFLLAQKKDRTKFK